MPDFSRLSVTELDNDGHTGRVTYWRVCSRHSRPCQGVLNCGRTSLRSLAMPGDTPHPSKSWGFI